MCHPESFLWGWFCVQHEGRTMYNARFKLTAAIAVIAGWGLNTAWAQHTVTITIPRHSQLTYVQRLNREGVAAVKQHNFGRAADLFYRAYLYDPADPFTLNNLGYVSELQGQLGRADKFYKLAAEQGCTASIDLSNVKQLQGKPMNTAFADLKELPMRVNRINVDAMHLLSENRGNEAEALLEQAQSLDPRNPYTLNNLGVAEESIGDYSAALKFYAAAASSGSGDPIVLTDNPSWWGKSLSDMAEANVERLQTRMHGTNSATTTAEMLNLRGVLADNQNDWATAREDFLKAYSLNPTNAFSLNNRAYVAERDGDLESAQFFYEKAWKAEGANLRVGRATTITAVGKPLFQVAAASDQKVDDALEVYSRERRQEQAPVELTPRDNAVPEQQSSPNAPPAPVSSTAPQLP
jgi:Flp pilus assembly protein TadD